MHGFGFGSLETGGTKCKYHSKYHVMLFKSQKPKQYLHLNSVINSVLKLAPQCSWSSSLFFCIVAALSSTCMRRHKQGELWTHAQVFKGGQGVLLPPPLDFGLLCICDRLWENPAYGIFCEIEFDAYLMSSTIELTCIQVSDQSRTSLWSYSTLLLRHTPIIQKLWSKDIAMHTYRISVYYVWTGYQLNGPGRSCSKWTQRSSKGRISSSIRRATSLMPKKLKRWANVQQLDEFSCT